MTYTALSMLAVFYLFNCAAALSAHPEENSSVHSKLCSLGGCSVLIEGSIKTLSDNDVAFAPSGPEDAARRTANLSHSTLDSAPAGAEPSQQRLKRRSSGDCNRFIDGNNSEAITLRKDDNCAVSIRGTNSGAITGAVTVSISGTNSAAISGARTVSIGGTNSAAITGSRKRGSSGGCRINVGSNNSGAITVQSARAKEQSAVSSDDTRSHATDRKDSKPAGAETSQPRLKGCSNGDCTVIIDGNNSGAITLPKEEECAVFIRGTNSAAITGAGCVQFGGGV